MINYPQQNYSNQMLLSSRLIFLTIAAFLCFPLGLQAQEKICGNRDAKPGEFPYTVHFKIVSHNLDGTARTSFHPYVHKCTGAIISPTFVISTAKCIIYDTQYHTLKIIAGIYRVDEVATRQDIRVVERFVDPGWETIESEDQVSLGRLQRPIVFNNVTNFVRLPKPNIKLHGMVVLSSWGKIWKWNLNEYREYQYTANEVLQATYLPIISHQECVMARLKYDQYFHTDDFFNQFCTGPLRGDRESCNADLGSPLVQDGVLVGLTNFRRDWYQCRCVNLIAIHIDVSRYMDFILDHVTDLPDY